jgi:phosphoglycolate phosphatase
MVNTLLFDLDGTLVDSVPDIAFALNTMRAQLHLPTITLEVVKNIVGRGFPTTVQLILELDMTQTEAKKLHAKAFSLTLQAYSENHGKHTTIYVGVLSTLIFLKKHHYKMAIVTNKEEAHATALLEKVGLASYFDCIIGGDTTDHYKPHPDSIFEALSRLKSKPNDAIMIGDSKTDIDAAHNAAIPVVAVTYGYNHNTPISHYHPEYIIDAMSELPSLLKTLTTTQPLEIK